MHLSKIFRSLWLNYSTKENCDMTQTYTDLYNVLDGFLILLALQVNWLLYSALSTFFAICLLMLLIVRTVWCKVSLKPKAKKKTSVQLFIAYSRWFIEIEKFLLWDLLILSWLNSPGCASLICYHLRAEQIKATNKWIGVKHGPHLTFQLEY